MRLEHSFIPNTKIISNIRPETIKLLEETLFDINHSSIFLWHSPKAKEIKAKINKCNLIKLKSFCTAKETTD